MMRGLFLEAVSPVCYWSCDKNIWQLVMKMYSDHLTKAGMTSFYFYTSGSDFYFRMNAER